MNLIRKNLTVLLADDDPDEHAKFIRAILGSSETIRVDSAYNGMQLLDHLLRYDFKKGHLPDLIITDLYMPFAGGLQVLKQIKSNIHFRHIPIIVFSKNHDSNIRSKVIEHGANEFHQKPGEYNELEKIIEHILVKISLTNVA